MVPLGEAAVTIEFTSESDDAILAELQNWLLSIQSSELRDLVECVPGWNSLTVHFDALQFSVEALQDRLMAVAHRAVEPVIQPARRIEIPVVYGGDFGPDLKWVAEQLGLTEENVVSRHAGGEYRVRLIGFSPGFAYLSGLPQELTLPRRASPRVQVPAGSVAMAGIQAGIYPATTPGGWHLLGRTPFRLFNPTRMPPCTLEIGDRVTFHPIAAADFAHSLKGSL